MYFLHETVFFLFHLIFCFNIYSATHNSSEVLLYTFLYEISYLLYYYAVLNANISFLTVYYNNRGQNLYQMSKNRVVLTRTKFPGFSRFFPVSSKKIPVSRYFSNREILETLAISVHELICLLDSLVLVMGAAVTNEGVLRLCSM